MPAAWLGPTASQRALVDGHQSHLMLGRLGVHNKQHPWELQQAVAMWMMTYKRGSTTCESHSGALRWLSCCAGRLYQRMLENADRPAFVCTMM